MDEKPVFICVLNSTIFEVLHELITDLELHVKREMWHIANSEANQVWGIMRVMSLHLARKNEMSEDDAKVFWEYERRRKEAAAQIPTML